VLLAAIAAIGIAGCGGRANPAEMHVAASATRLRALLVAAHVPIGRGKSPTAASFPAAWTVFQRFGRLPVDSHDLSGEQPDDDLLYEFGVFESNFYGTSFEVELTRQYELAGGDIQQVHLVVHFPVAAYIAITRHLRATTCVPGSCAFRCFFADDDAIVPHPCRLVSQRARGYRVNDMTLWASQTSGDDVSAQRANWIQGVASSPVFRGLLLRQVRPDGYEVWQESAE